VKERMKLKTNVDIDFERFLGERGGFVRFEEGFCEANTILSDFTSLIEWRGGGIMGILIQKPLVSS
jgi:hypothetical protein